MPNPKSWFGRGNTRALLISGGILALFISGSALAVGEGDPLTGGERNPNANQTQQFSVETEIIGDIAASTEQTGGYVTRQSNTRTGADAGGAAIYGCRAPAGGTAGGKEACLRANNLGGGTALELRSNGLPALFQVGGNPATAVDQPPFATNATGMVANLNADKLDGLDAEDIALAGNLFARVNADGTAAEGGRGTTAAARTEEGVYTVTFEGDVSDCAYQATQTTSDAVPGPISANAVEGSPNVVQVRTFDEAEADDETTVDADEDDGNQPEDRPFHLTATC